MHFLMENITVKSNIQLLVCVIFWTMRSCVCPGLNVILKFNRKISETANHATYKTDL